jgi:hypothetical protein
MEVLGTFLDVTVVTLQELVVFGRDTEAEHVYGLRLATEVGGQLLGDEHVVVVCDHEPAVDRVVVCDRYEVHSPALGQLVDLLGRSRTFR